MGLIDAIGEPPVTAGVCGVKRAAYSLDAADAADLEALVGDARWPAQTLQRRLREQGVVVSDEAIRRHRNKTCSCFPAAKAVKTDGAR